MTNSFQFASFIYYFYFNLVHSCMIFFLTNIVDLNSPSRRAAATIHRRCIVVNRSCCNITYYFKHGHLRRQNNITALWKPSKQKHYLIHSKDHNPGDINPNYDWRWVNVPREQWDLPQKMQKFVRYQESSRKIGAQIRCFKYDIITAVKIM
jgi:hypothetical protein